MSSVSLEDIFIVLIIFAVIVGSFLDVFVRRLTKNTVSRLVFPPLPEWGDSAPFLLPYPFFNDFDSERNNGARWHLSPVTAESSIPIGLYPSGPWERRDQCGLGL